MWTHTPSLVGFFGDLFRGDRGEPHSFPGAFLTARHTCGRYTQCRFAGRKTATMCLLATGVRGEFAVLPLALSVFV